MLEVRAVVHYNYIQVKKKNIYVELNEEYGNKKWSLNFHNKPLYTVFLILASSLF